MRSISPDRICSSASCNLLVHLVSALFLCCALSPCLHSDYSVLPGGSRVPTVLFTCHEHLSVHDDCHVYLFCLLIELTCLYCEFPQSSSLPLYFSRSLSPTHSVFHLFHHPLANTRLYFKLFSYLFHFNVSFISCFCSLYPHIPDHLMLT